ncbi:MAG: hypothetical protein EZS28_012317 [Streblomastix strix]|uniref:Uncharacterized protein n=1 Tax=Streblomastix strix TaxID=222440 RepID=A0A5J4WCV3_9EUKA|nr:MAG: hypothetical protein EZS28_012317 [Streblomastix strix]
MMKNLLLEDRYSIQSIHGRVHLEIAQAIEELPIRVLKLPKFTNKLNELELFRNLIIRCPPIQRPEDIIGLFVKKESSDTLSLDRYLTGIQERMFNFIMQLPAILTSFTGQAEPHPQEIIICVLKSIKIFNSMGSTRRDKCLYLSLKPVTTTDEYDFKPQHVMRLFSNMDQKQKCNGFQSYNQFNWPSKQQQQPEKKTFEIGRGNDKARRVGKKLQDSA